MARPKKADKTQAQSEQPDARKVKTQKQPQDPANIPAVAGTGLHSPPDLSNPDTPRAEADKQNPERPELVPSDPAQPPKKKMDEPAPEALEERTPEGTPTGKGCKTDTLSTWPTI